MKVRDLVDVLKAAKRDASVVYVDAEGKESKLTNFIAVDEDWGQLTIISETAYKCNEIPELFIPAADAEQIGQALDHEYRNFGECSTLFDDYSEFRSLEVHVCEGICISPGGGSCWETAQNIAGSIENGTVKLYNMNRQEGEGDKDE